MGKQRYWMTSYYLEPISLNEIQHNTLLLKADRLLEKWRDFSDARARAMLVWKCVQEWSFPSPFPDDCLEMCSGMVV